MREFSLIYSFIMKQIIILLIFLSGLASATQINIYYPNNNTTTDCYYANGSEYKHIINNIINDNVSVVILKNQPITDDIISNPSKLANIKYIGLFILIGLFGLIIIGLLKVFKGAL